MHLQIKFLLLITRLQKYLYILNGYIKSASQLIRQYFTIQNFPMYGSLLLSALLLHGTPTYTTEALCLVSNVATITPFTAISMSNTSCIL